MQKKRDPPAQTKFLIPLRLTSGGPDLGPPEIGYSWNMTYLVVICFNPFEQNMRSCEFLETWSPVFQVEDLKKSLKPPPRTYIDDAWEMVLSFFGGPPGNFVRGDVLQVKLQVG